MFINCSSCTLRCTRRQSHDKTKYGRKKGHVPQWPAGVKLKFDRSGIRTRATEVTGALNQRLRPLGHPAYKKQGLHKIQFYCKEKRIKTAFKFKETRHDTEMLIKNSLITCYPRNLTFMVFSWKENLYQELEQNTITISR